MSGTEIVNHDKSIAVDCESAQESIRSLQCCCLAKKKTGIYTVTAVLLFGKKTHRNLYGHCSVVVWQKKKQESIRSLQCCCLAKKNTGIYTVTAVLLFGKKTISSASGRSVVTQAIKSV